MSFLTGTSTSGTSTVYVTSLDLTASSTPVVTDLYYSDVLLIAILGVLLVDLIRRLFMRSR